MPLQWTPAIATGNETIDNQHKELFDRVNAFAHAITQEAEAEQLEPTLKFLEEYIAFHFSAEEKLLADNGYPDLAVHKSQHAYYVRNLQNIKLEYARKGPSPEITDLVYKHVTTWLLAHIEKADGAWAAWLRKNKTA